MKNYTVYVHYEGCMVYKVSADSEESAREIAESAFAEASPTELADNLADYSCDSEES